MAAVSDGTWIPRMGDEPYSSLHYCTIPKSRDNMTRENSVIAALTRCINLRSQDSKDGVTDIICMIKV